MRLRIAPPCVAAMLSVVAGGAACGGKAAPAPAGGGGDHHAAHDHAGHKAGGHHGMQHSFDGAEEWAKVFDDPERDAWQRPDEVVALLALAPGMTVVDLGAGTGYFEARLSRAVGDGGRVIAADVEPDMVRYLRERAEREGLSNVEARQVPYDSPDLEPASADRVLIVDVWHHLGDRAGYAARLAEGLRPGGFVAVVDFTMESPVGPPVEHRLSAEQIAEELATAGLRTEIADEDLPHQYVVIGRR